MLARSCVHVCVRALVIFKEESATCICSAGAGADEVARAGARERAVTVRRHASIESYAGIRVYIVRERSPNTDSHGSPQPYAIRATTSPEPRASAGVP